MSVQPLLRSAIREGIARRQGRPKHPGDFGGTAVAVDVPYLIEGQPSQFAKTRAVLIGRRELDNDSGLPISEIDRQRGEIEVFD